MLFPLKRALLVAGVALLTVAPVAHAGVKEGVDAWERGEYPAAVAEWRGPAKAGDPDAQFNLAQAYKLGRGVPVDLKMAEGWYAKAANQGHEQAMVNYGLVLFQNGNRAAAMPWLAKAADHGDPRAQYVYGTALFNGDNVTKDWVKAYAMMTRASAAGLPQAAASMSEMDKYIPLQQRQQGITMAQRMADQQQQTAANWTPPPLPQPSPAPQPVRPTPKPYSPPPPKPVAVKPAPTPAPVATSGAWRVQLGAFGDQGSAKAQWAKIKPRVSGLSGLQPYIVNAGKVVRLQAGPLASKAAADKVCASATSAGVACFATKP